MDYPLSKTLQALYINSEGHEDPMPTFQEDYSVSLDPETTAPEGNHANKSPHVSGIPKLTYNSIAVQKLISCDVSLNTRRSTNTAIKAVCCFSENENNIREENSKIDFGHKWDMCGRLIMFPFCKTFFATFFNDWRSEQLHHLHFFAIEFIAN